MRIRQVKPDFWRDELIAGLPDTVRLFYIGMWQEADDAGWLRWNVSEIALDLYGYQPRGRRERLVTERGAALVAVGRLVIHDCGHAFVPKLTRHQKFGGRPFFGIRDVHARDCPPLIASNRDQSRAIADDRRGKERERVRVGEGTERKGIAEKTSFDEAIARANAKAGRAA